MLIKVVPVIALVAAVWLSGTAEARFLQTDPVGYRDDLNLYTYVVNDPLNHNDPTGMSCTVTTGENGQQTAQCRIDSVLENGRQRPATNADHQRFARFERAYTRTVNRLLANPERSVRVVVPNSQGRNVAERDRSFAATGREVAQSLSTRRVEARPDLAGGMDTPATGYTNVYREGLAGRPGYGVPDRGFFGNVATGLTHEGMHNPGPDRRMTISPLLGMDPWSGLHQVPYNQAAEDLLGY